MVQFAIARKILIFGILSGLISLMLACFGFGIVEFYKIKNESMVKLNSQMDILTYNLQTPLLFEDKEAADKTLLSLQGDRSINKVKLYNAAGREFASFMHNDAKGNIKLVRNIFYDKKPLGRLEIEAVYLGIKDKYITYLFVSILIIIISILAAYIISAPLRMQVSKSIIRSHRDLEMRVKERTEELTTTNKMLNAEIEERKRIEIAQAQAQEEIQHKKQELETLFYIVSHDLKEPLRSMEYFSSTVNEQYADKLDDKGKDYLQRVVKAGNRLRLLLDDILVISRARNMEKPVHVFEGRAIVEEALSRLDTKIKETNAIIKISNNFPTFKVEKTWAVHAVFNLISNALKYTREGCQPEIEIDAYSLNGSTGKIGIVVRDRGFGVKPEYAEKIFELFQRAVDRNIEGTGAGLAIVREVARRHGGKAWVQPREGGGSEFIITFSST